MRKTICSSIFFILGSFLLSCKSTNNKSVEYTSDATDAATLETDLVNLEISNFMIDTAILNNERWPSLSYTQSDSVEFVKWKACKKADTAECRNGGASMPGHVIAGLSEGLWDISVTPCMQDEAQELCGKELHALYQQVAPQNISLNELLAKRDNLVQKVRNLGLRVYKAAVAYRDSISGCKDKQVESLIPKDTYTKLVNLGAEKIGVGLLDENAELVLQDNGSTAIISDLGTVSETAKVAKAAGPSKAEIDKENASEASAKVILAGGVLLLLSKSVEKKIKGKVKKELNAGIGKAVDYTYDATTGALLNPFLSQPTVTPKTKAEIEAAKVRRDAAETSVEYLKNAIAKAQSDVKANPNDVNKVKKFNDLSRQYEDATKILAEADKSYKAALKGPTPRKAFTLIPFTNFKADIPQIARGFVIASTLVLAAGSIAYVAINSDKAPGKIAEQFATDILDLTASPCALCVDSTRAIISASDEAKSLRNEIKNLTIQIQKLTGEKEKKPEESKPS